MGATSVPAAALRRLSDQVRSAVADRRLLRIRAGGTKDFFVKPLSDDLVDPRDCTGVVAYEPTELVITVRAGMPLADLEATLAAHDQMLGFEPPHFGHGATVGGCVAAGFAGPRRVASGAVTSTVRDSVLGAKLLDGNAQVLSFGGTVMKNVAGYDVSRLLAGSFGTLGVILELSIRVAPIPRAEATVRLEREESAAKTDWASWVRRGWPLSASVWHQDAFHARFSGSPSSVDAAVRESGGERIEPAAARSLWQSVREQTMPFFSTPGPLWRIAVPAHSTPIELPGAQLVEWGGSLRWLATSASDEEVRRQATSRGGHATLFRRAPEGVATTTPLPETVARIEARVRATFDPAGIFDPGRTHANESR